MAFRQSQLPVLIVYPEFREFFGLTAAKFPMLEVRFWTPAPAAVHKAVTPDTEVLATAKLPNLGPNIESLRWVHLFASGYDYLLGNGLPNPALLITNRSGAYSDRMAKFVLMRMLMHARKAEAIAEGQKQREWRSSEQAGTALRGKRLIIIGGGSIGSEVSQLARAFEMEAVIAGRADFTTFPRGLIAEAKYLVIAASLNPSTKRR